MSLGPSNLHRKAASDIYRAYFPTGKTHTMLQDGEGIVPRALQQLLQHGAVAISLLQIYAENVQDLLAPAEPCK
jgi:Kinesin motor domain